MDSAWALRQVSTADGCGDPGRMLTETRRECRDLAREYEQFVPHHMVEFYRHSPEARRSLYPAIPDWWGEVWVSQNMYVPLPPVLTYRSREFLPDRIGTPEGEFYQRVLEAEWTALVFARWCSDVPQRGIMWALPPRVRGNVREFGVPALIGRGTYHLHDVEKWLWEHDRHPWSSGTQHYHVRGKSGSHDEQFRVLTEFVRPFPGYRVSPPGGVRTRSGNWAISHTFHEAEDSLVTRQLGSMEENYADSYANSYVRPPVPRLRSAPIPEVAYDDHLYDREIPSTVLLKLREARVIRCVEHYASDNVANAGDRDDIPIREGTIVTCIKALSRGYTERSEEVQFLRVEVESMRAAIARSDDRERKAEARSDLLASAYSLVEKEIPNRKRARDE